MSSEIKQAMLRKLPGLLFAIFLAGSGILAGCGPAEGTAEWHVNQALELAEQGNYDAAIEACNRAIELNSGCIEAYNNRAVAYRKKGQYDLAIIDCNRAIRLDPNFIKAYCNRAVAYCNKGKYSLAIFDCDRVIELQPKLAITYNNRAYVYNQMGQYELATADCNRAIELDDKLALAYSNRAYAYLSTGQNDLAIADATRAIELDDKLALAYSNRASAYLSTGEYDLCIADATRAIKLEPLLAEAYASRGNALKEQGKEAAAEADFKMFTMLTEIPDDEQATTTEELPAVEITVKATLDGEPWEGALSYTLDGPGTEAGTSVPQSFSGLPSGTYTVADISGGPEGALLSRISPPAIEELPAGEAATLTVVFVSSGGITVKATLDGVAWSGEAGYTIQGTVKEPGTSFPQSFDAIPIGTYTIANISGGPRGALLKGISPAGMLELAANETATLTLAFVSTGRITVNATVDGEPWFGKVSYTIDGPGTEAGFAIPQSFSELPIGTYTIADISGGPEGALLSKILPASEVEVSPGGEATVTLAFVYKGNVTVKATLNGTSWTGQVNYALEGTEKELGTLVPQSFMVAPGTYTISYNTSGPDFSTPQYVLLSGSAPSGTVEVTPGGTVTYTFAFVSVTGHYGQGADLSVTTTVDDATPSERDTIMYTITLTNSGPDAATNIEVTDILPYGVSFVSAIASQGTYSNSLWDVGSLYSGGSATLRITATVNYHTAETTITNTAEVTSVDQNDPDSTPNNNNSSEDDQDSADITVQS